MIRSYVLSILTFVGAWRPLKWSTGWKFFAYSTYSLLVFVIIITFFISQLVYLLQSSKDEIEEIPNVLFILLTTFCVVCKFVNLLISRRDIVNFTGILDNDICRPNGLEEIAIQNEFDRKMRTAKFFYGTLVGLSFGSATIGSLVLQQLPFSGWIPFDYTTFVGFRCAFIHQTIAHAYDAAVGGFYDLYFCNFLNLACAQLNILKFRLGSLTKTIIDATEDRNLNYDSRKLIEAKLLAKFVRHHLDIIRFTRSVNETFSAVILIQCTASTFILCMSTYLIKGMSIFSPEFTFMMVYVNCMLSELFLYCWYGNEIIFASINVGDALYTMEWPILTVETQKKLVMIMARSLRPIKLTSGNIIVLSIDTYTSILKLSYSIYNFLRDSE